MNNKSLLTSIMVIGFIASSSAFAHGGNKAERMLKRYDTNNDGKIEQAEIQAALTKGFTKLDKNANGSIDLEEFKDRRKMRNRGNPEKRFERLDKNGDKLLSKEEFITTRPFLERLDSNKDGILTHDELEKMGKGRR